MFLFDFFSGIGGFSLAGEWMGWEIKSFCEIDSFCQKVLKKHWPDVHLHGDIRTFSNDTYKVLKGDWIGPTIFTGGFPCQPFSSYGKRRGVLDNRNLWPEYFRVIRESKPTYAVGENVVGLATLENGKVLHEIFSDLESVGYNVEGYLISATGIEAWHRRQRLWIVAALSGWDHTNTPCSNSDSFRLYRKEEHKHRRTKPGGIELFNEQKCESGPMGEAISKEQFQHCGWGIEPCVGRVADGVPDRVDRIKSLGNAIVPQVAFEIFKAIQEHYLQVQTFC